MFRITAGRAPSLCEPEAIPRDAEVVPRDPLNQRVPTRTVPASPEEMARMRRLTIFLVGDVHFPDHDRPDADVKDDQLDTTLVEAITAPELSASTRELLAALDEAPGSLLVFTGDLTTRGDLDQYRSCTTYLDEAFLLSDTTRWEPDHLHVVPGNHDVNRPLAASTSAGDLTTKFEPLSQAWNDRGLDIIATDRVRPTAIGDGLATIAAYGLNSCFGCGEKRPLSTDLQDQIKDEVAKSGGDVSVLEASMRRILEDNSETIDAPAYLEDHIHEIWKGVRHSTSSTISMVVAHHNLLPQAQPRFAVYTDAMNGGMVRSRLSSLGVPVIYLHGHIHSDPVEIITQASPDSGQLLCISAPEFRDGFIKIDVLFSNIGQPIGCEVTRFIVRLHGGTSIEPPIRIRFDAYSAEISGLASTVAGALLSDPKISSLAELRTNLTMTMGVDDSALSEAIEEIEWLGLVEILNHHSPPCDWRLRAIATHD